MRETETGAAFHELIDLVRTSDALFVGGDRAGPDELAVVEGYRWLTEILSVALDCFLWADPARPAFVDVVSPTRKWGGDNADAFYSYVALDPARTYRIGGRRGDAVYFSLTIYGGPDDGRWSNRIIATANDRTMPIGDDGSFELLLGPDVETGPSGVHLDTDAVAIVTRDYLVDPTTGTRTTFTIECLDPVDPPRPTDADMAAGFRRATNFLRDLLAIFPLAPSATPNTVEEPYPVPAATYGWAAGDAAYAMGSFALADDDALVLEGTTPPCAFWNLCLWNQYLQTFDYRYEQVTINGGQIVTNDDGSWRIVVAATDPGVDNWLSTAGHASGMLWFRWFLAEHVPARPTATVVKLSDL